MQLHTARLSFVLAAIALGCSLEPPAPSGVVDESSHRVLALGEVVGSAGRFGAHAWRGVPYARPPVGGLRWREPQPPEAWGERLEAVANPPACMQIANPAGGADGADPGEPTGSEDCLYLNVFAPRFTPDAVPEGDARLPVMFWIHGGGNTVGDVAMYDGGRLATEHGVIVVAVQYRLGPFGWFRHPALRSEGASDAGRSGNFGTLDLIAALEFVSDHIGAFGGDPDNVTIFGESAGGRNVVTLLTAPSAGGLFHRAIVMSGSSSRTDPDVAEAYADAAPPGHAASSREVVLALLVAEGTASDRAEARRIADGMGAGETARFLRGRDAGAVLKAYAPRAFGMIDVPQVFSDGTVLTAESTAEAFATGNYHRVPLMLGTTRDEGKTFQIGNAELVDFRFGFLPTPRDWDRYDREAEYGAKLWKLDGVDGLARRARRVQGASVYAYRFDWDEEPTRLFVLDFSRLLGAAHGLDVFFTFGDFELGALAIPFFDDANEASREELSRVMRSYWAEFAHTGRPGTGHGGDLPEWTPWPVDPETTAGLMVLDSQAGGGPRMVAEVVTPASVVAEVAEDPRFSNDDERCAFLRGHRRRDRIEAALAPLCGDDAAGR